MNTDNIKVMTINAQITTNTPIINGDLNTDGVDTSNLRKRVAQLEQNKLDKNLGVENSGKYLQVDANGNIQAVNTDAENDVIEGYFYNSRFYLDEEHTQPLVGERGKIYIDLTTNLQYRYNRSAYVQLTVNVIDDTQESATTTYSSKKIGDTFVITTNTFSSSDVDDLFEED